MRRLLCFVLGHRWRCVLCGARYCYPHFKLVITSAGSYSVDCPSMDFRCARCHVASEAIAGDWPSL